MVKFLEPIFSIKREVKHTCYNFLGLKLKVSSKKNLKQIEYFFNHRIDKNTVLLIEPNNSHYETLLGYYKYLKELNFNVEIITRGFTDNLNKQSTVLLNCLLKNLNIVVSNINQIIIGLGNTLSKRFGGLRLFFGKPVT